MTQEEFFKSEDKRNAENAKAYRAHLKALEAYTKRQVVAQEKMVKYLEKALKPSKSIPPKNGKS